MVVLQELVVLDEPSGAKIQVALPEIAPDPPVWETVTVPVGA